MYKRNCTVLNMSDFREELEYFRTLDKYSKCYIKLVLNCLREILYLFCPKFYVVGLSLRRYFTILLSEGN